VAALGVRLGHGYCIDQEVDSLSVDGVVDDSLNIGSSDSGCIGTLDMARIDHCRGGATTTASTDNARLLHGLTELLRSVGPSIPDDLPYVAPPSPKRLRQ
jgi:hypothetical protein